MGNLSHDICAMANMSGGVLVLGIDQVGSGRNIERFSKNGFDRGEEDSVNKRISDHLYQIQPVPVIRTHPLPYEGGKFYMLLRVKPIVKYRPYVVKGQCFIRVFNTSVPASRETILNLCKLTIDRKVNVEIFGMATMLIRKSIEKVEEINRTRDIPLDMPFVDVDWFANAGFNCNWLLAEYDLLQENPEKGPTHREGFFSTIHLLRQLNNAIDRFNKKAMMPEQRHQAFEWLYGQWGGYKFQEIVKYLNRTSEAVNDFLREE